MSKPGNAENILKTIDNWRRLLYPAWDTERRIEIYANGGPPPTEDDTCENDIVPLGFASSHMKKEMEPLLDPLDMDPGILDMECLAPAIKDPARTSQISLQITAGINKVVNARLKPTLIKAAGRATVTGRAWFYRTSPNDWVIKSGRIIHPVDAGIDILDSEWREWAFDGKISLRTIDERLKSSSPNKYGWNYEGLKQLKEWIMALEAEKTSTPNNQKEWIKRYDRELWDAVDLTSLGYTTPINVYWYFKKNGKVTKNHPLYGGHEGVDLYCISRFGSSCDVKSEVKNNITYKTLQSSYGNTAREALKRMKQSNYHSESPEEEKKEDEAGDERLLFFLPNVFKSIEECLIFHNDDASVSGEPTLDEIRGSGKTAMPKLAMMEGLLTNLIMGLGFAAQATWVVQPGVPEEYIRQLQRGGLRHGQPMPPGVDLMQKQNALTGFGSGMQAIAMLDQGVASDSVANQQGTFGGSKAEFASQAQAMISQGQNTSNRRLRNWLSTLDKVVTMVGRTLCRSWPEQREAFPCYEDAMRMRMWLKSLYKIHEDEWDADRWDFKARRLAGGLMRDQSIAINSQALVQLGPVFPKLTKFFGQELLRAFYGDTKAAQLVASSEDANSKDTEKAQRNVTIAFVTGQPPMMDPMDDPVEHARVASELAQQRITSASNSGKILSQELVGIMSVLQYAANAVLQLPEQIATPALDQLSNLSQAVNAIPQQTAEGDGITQKEAIELQIKSQNQDRLRTEGAKKLELAGNKQMIEMKRLGLAMEQSRENTLSQSTSRAKAMQDMQLQLAQSDAQFPTITA